MKGILNITGFTLFWALAALLTMGAGLVVLAVLLVLTHVGASSRAQKAEAIVQTTMMKDESLVAQAIQHRAFALWSRRSTIAITNSRIIIINRGIVGGFKMADIQWKDLQDAKLEQNVLESICGSNLNFLYHRSRSAPISINGIPSNVAATIYSRAQSEEQAWEEKRRIRAMEEVRAAAGGVVVHTGQSGGTTAQAPAGNQILSEIQEAKKLLDSGVISDAEFQEMKSKILATA